MLAQYNSIDCEMSDKQDIKKKSASGNGAVDDDGIALRLIRDYLCDRWDSMRGPIIDKEDYYADVPKIPQKTVIELLNELESNSSIPGRDKMIRSVPRYKALVNNGSIDTILTEHGISTV